MVMRKHDQSYFFVREFIGADAKHEMVNSRRWVFFFFFFFHANSLLPLATIVVKQMIVFLWYNAFHRSSNCKLFLRLEEKHDRGLCRSGKRKQMGVVGCL
jgi:hypothetical protein